MTVMNSNAAPPPYTMTMSRISGAAGKCVSINQAPTPTAASDAAASASQQRIRNSRSPIASPCRLKGCESGPWSVGRIFEDRFDLLGQLAGRERLRHVIVGAECHALLPVHLAPFGRQHDDVDALPRRVGSDGLTDVVAVALGDHHVEQDQVGSPTLDCGQRLVAVAGHTHVEARLLHQKLQGQDYIRFVFNDENGFRHSLVLPRTPTGGIVDRGSPQTNQYSTIPLAPCLLGAGCQRSTGT